MQVPSRLVEETWWEGGSPVEKILHKGLTKVHLLVIKRK